MDIYLINLTRRPDRLAAMEAEAARAGLTLTRIAAVDAREAPPSPLFAAKGPLGEIPRGDQACALSHVAAWRALLASGKSHAAILEDDVVLSALAGAALTDATWVPTGVDLIKLEHYGPAGQRVLLSDMRGTANGFRIGRMRSRHTGAAAYLLSRKAAERLLAVTRFTLPIDHLMFNPNNSPLFAALSPWQLLPPIARQKDFVGAKSDIEATRIAQRDFSPAYVKRELVRFGYDLKLVPQQLALLASGRARFVRVGSN